MEPSAPGVIERISHGVAALAEHVPKVLADPRAYPDEAVVLALLAALVLVLLVLIALATVEVTRKALARRLLGVRRVGASGRRVMAMGMALAVSVAVGVIVSLLPAIPPVGRACDACHALDAPVAAWQADPHSGVSCYGCHARPGIVGMVQAGAEGAARLLGSRTATGTQTPVFEGRCLDCHSALADGVTEGAVRMRHADVIDAGFGCLGCHPHVGHDSLVREPLPVTRSRMDLCLVCHDGQAASSECVVCHERSPADTDVAAPGGSVPIAVTCEGCHRPDTSDRCVECHGLVLPHPAEFRGDHARRSWRDPGLCARCHEDAAPLNGCDCHVESGVHGTYNEWFPQHGPLAGELWPGGCRCHAESFCLACHDRMP